MTAVYNFHTSCCLCHRYSTADG